MLPISHTHTNPSATLTQLYEVLRRTYTSFYKSTFFVSLFHFLSFSLFSSVLPSLLLYSPCICLFFFFNPFLFKQHYSLPFQIPLFPVLITSLSFCMLAISPYNSPAQSPSLLFSLFSSVFLCLSVLSAMWLKGHVCVVCRLNKLRAASW